MSRRIPPLHDLGPMEAPVTVIGDVHLSPEAPETAARFLRAVEAVGAEGGTLILLGDLFDSWAGRPLAEAPFSRQILDPLRELARAGVRLAFVAGNRDYLFDGAPGLDIEIWPDVVATRWGERRVVLAHGDLLCTADHGYLAMRGRLQSPLGLRLTRAMPYRVVSYLGWGLRRFSERSTPRNQGARLGIDYGLAREWLEAYDADVLVLGHVHTGVHHRLPGDRPRDVLVLKDWDGPGSVVRFDGGTIALERPPRPAR